MELNYRRTMKGGIALFLALIAFCIALYFGAIALVAFVFMLLWNYVVVSVFAVGALTFWKSAALIWLLSIVGGLLGVKKGKN